jgi:hypothetical protein
MTEVPKIVYDRLRAARPERGLPEGAVHPDADLLAAFAEQALSATERNNMLEHLALCGDCREVIAVALPPMEVASLPFADETEAQVAPLQAKNKRTSPKLAWPNLRWAALAAGVVVAGSLLIMHPGRLNPPPMQSSAKPQDAITAPAVPGAGSETLSSASSSREQSTILAKAGEAKASQPKASQAQPKQSPLPSATRLASTTVSPASLPQIVSPLIASSNQPSVPGKTDDARPKPESQLARNVSHGNVSAGQPAAPSLQVRSEILIADNKKDSTSADKPVVLPEEVGALDYNASAGRGASEAVAVSGAAVTVQTTSSARGTLMARNEAPPIEKAKPVPQTGTGQAQNTQNTLSSAVSEPPLNGRSMASLAKLAPSPGPAGALAVTWTITAGVLQRSLDSGQSWQDALRADHKLLCQASHGVDVWTGGQAGTIFHSVDSGITWLQVHPSVKGHALTSDVTRIDIRDDVPGPVEIVVSTGDNESWSSADGGKTWQKK